MGVQDLLALMKPFMGSILSYAQPVKPVRTLQVSRWPVDDNLKPITAPAVDLVERSTVCSELSFCHSITFVKIYY